MWRAPLRIGICTVLGYCLFISLALSQIDTEFWFVAPNVTEGHGDAPVLLRFTAFERDARVMITQPANNAWFPVNLVVPAGQSRLIDLTARLFDLENTPSFSVLSHGLFIVSDEPVTAYYEVNHTFNPDIFSLKGRNALGKQFLIPAQNYYSNASGLNPPARTAFDIVATEAQTRIQITPSVALPGRPALVPFEIILNRGETYSVEAPGSDASQQLTGSRVEADQLVAITLKHDSNLNGQCYDLAGDQLVPLEVLGNEYIVVKGFLEGGDQVFVMATEDNTSLTVDGLTANTTADIAGLRTGQMYRFTLLDNFAHIKSTAPVYVVHMTGFGCETGMAILPKLECTGSTRVSVNRSTDEFFGLILITEKGNEETFQTSPNRNITSNMFEVVPGTDDRYVAARVDLTNPVGINQALEVWNDKGVFHLGIINGGERSGTRYGYFSDFKTLKIQADASKICLGGDLFLEATGSDRYRWFGSEAIVDQTNSRIQIQPDTTTLYGVIGADEKNGCLDTAFLEIEVFQWARPLLEISPTCLGADITIQYEGMEEVEDLTWISGMDTMVIEPEETFHIVYDKPGFYELQLSARNPAGCISDTTLILSVGGQILDLDTSYSIILGEKEIAGTQVLEGSLNRTQISWTPGEGLSCVDCLQPEFSPPQTTAYLLRLVDSLGCITEYQTTVYVDSPVFVPNVFSPDGDGINDFLEIFPHRPESFEVREWIIVNRWGQVVYRVTENYPRWDGTIQGEEAEEGVYIYLLEGVQKESGNKFQKTGSVFLMR